MNAVRSFVIAFVAGGLCALGLFVSGMTSPPNVLAFLDVAGNWNPSLAFVMVGAIAVHALAYRLVAQRDRPLLAARFSLPVRRPVDWQLVSGAIIFGIGWGLAGYCPGPGIVVAGMGALPGLAFLLAMIVGIELERTWTRHASSIRSSADSAAQETLPCKHV